MTGKGGFNAYRGPQDAGQVGLSQAGWPTLQQSAAATGMKHMAAPSQSPKKTAAKVACQVQIQQRVQQQALQPSPAHIFLPPAPVGNPRPFETTKRSLAVGNEEQEHLNQETRAGQALFTKE